MSNEERKRKNEYMRLWRNTAAVNRKTLWRRANPEKDRAQRVAWQQSKGKEADRKFAERPSGRMSIIVTDAKKRAREKGLEFDEAIRAVLQKDPPTECLCCHSPLDYSFGNGYGARRRKPSLDRFDNSKGYTIENIRIICYRCNDLKRDATLEEIEAIAAYMRGH